MGFIDTRRTHNLCLIEFANSGKLLDTGKMLQPLLIGPTFGKGYLKVDNLAAIKTL